MPPGSSINSRSAIPAAILNTNSHSFPYICSLKERIVIKISFPKNSLKIRKEGDDHFVFDELRKKWLLLTPEEWVRQHAIQFLIKEKGYSPALLNVEKQLFLNGVQKRYDAVIFNTDGSIFMIVECKAPEIKISQTTFDQIAQYNMALKAQYLLVTNGIEHYICQMDFQAQKYVFLKEIPSRH